MGKSWRDEVEVFDKNSAQKYLDGMKGKKNKDLENWRIGGRYVPSIDCSTLDDEEHFPGQQVAMRILPGIKSNPWPSWLFSIPRFNLRVFRKHDESIGLYQVDAIYTLNEKLKDQCPFAALRSELYNDGSERLKEFANKLWPKERHFMNVIVRFLMLEPKDGGKSKLRENVGPRVLDLPPTPVEKILGAWKNPKIGNPIDLDEAYDFMYHMVIREADDDKGDASGKKLKFPNYDGCEFDRIRTKAGTEEEIDEWMTNLPNLAEEYKETKLSQQEQIADKCRDVAYGKVKNKTTHQVKEDMEHETEDEDVDKGSPYSGKGKDEDEETTTGNSRMNRRRSRDEDEDEGPRRRRDEDEDPDDKPRSRRSRDEGEDEETTTGNSRMNRRRSRSEDDEPEPEEKPRSRRSRDDEDAEPEEKPRSRRSRDEDEDKASEPEDKPRSRSRVRDEEEAEPEERPRSRRRDTDEGEEPQEPRSRRRGDEEEDPIDDGEDDVLDKEMEKWEKSGGGRKRSNEDED